jgi:hypothetical protein
MHLTYINITTLIIDHINNISTTSHKATTTQDIRGSPPVWGYIHQLFFFFFISFFQSSYMHQATMPTPHRTGDIRAPCQILLPRVHSKHRASTQSVHKALTKYLHLALQTLTRSCTKPTSHALSRSMTSNY